MGEDSNKHVDFGIYVAMGVSLGSVLGIVFIDNIGLGISFGLLAATVVYFAVCKKDQ